MRRMAVLLPVLNLLWLWTQSSPTRVAALSSSSSTPRSRIQYRKGTAADAWPMAWRLGRELMNPLGTLRTERFLVAHTPTTRDRVGWAQIRPLTTRDADVEGEADDVMWDDFEADAELKVPVGWKSLPWTADYRRFARQAADRRQGRRETVRKQVQQETPPVYELASVWVHPSYRRQGIGTELVRQVLQRHADTAGPLEQVYLLTLDTTADWYRVKFGFHIVPLPYVPPQMALEVRAGKIITSAIGAELVCMQGSSEIISKKQR